MSNGDIVQKMKLTLPGMTSDDVHVESVSGHEAVGSAYEFTVDVLSKDPISLDSLIGKAVKLELTIVDETAVVHGVVSKARTLDPTPNREFCYGFSIEPGFAMLRYSAQNQVYGSDKDVTVVDIIEGELSDANKAGSSTSSNRIARTLQHQMLAEKPSYPKLDFVMQYRETDFDFICRLCEKFGIFFTFQHDGDQEKIVFGDRKEHFKKLSGRQLTEELPYRSKQQILSQSDFAIWSFNAEYAASSGTVALREYNEQTPKVSLSVSENASHKGQGVSTLYGENYSTVSEGNFLAKRRVEQLQAEHLSFRGQSNIPLLRPGLFFKLTDHPISDLDGLYIVVEVEHSITMATPFGFSSPDKTAAPYNNTFRCVPFDAGYRTPCATPKPTVHGYLSAVIDGETEGKRAELDDYGRYKVRVLDEESGLSKGKASAQVRKMEPYGGGDGYGAHSTLLIGTEVILGFVQGDPDRPIILGAVSNGEKTNPITSTNQNVAHRTRTSSGIVMQMSDGAV
ncbi:type VI secretion system tip protein TssI/VgrG [Roseibium polysiphoniae]|uniref:type VI secretion system Vgr family protein n=1 Tax=Roseibium polysiphoniae TaxID=2571221 RepID=UPI0032982E22